MPRFQVYACVLSAIVIAWAGLVSLVKPTAAGMRIVEDFAEIPLRVADWQGTSEEEFDRQSYSILTTCTVASRSYVDQSGNRAELSIVYGRDLGDFHQPEICMQGSGWKPTKSRTVWLNPVGGRRHAATGVTLTDGTSDIVMVYWFYMGGRISPVLGQAKLRTFWLAVLGKELKPSAMVKFTAPVSIDEDTALRSAMRLSELLEKSIVDIVSKPARYEPSDEVFKRHPEGEQP